MSLLEQLGAYVAHGGRDSVSKAVRQAVRLHVADTVAAWVAGAHTPEGRLLKSAHGALISVPVSERGTTRRSLDRVMTNCALARLSEIDDIHLASGTTPGSLVVPAALTIGHSLGAADRESLVEAIVVGYDATVRLGASLTGPALLSRGIWPTYLAAPFGVAAVASRLLGLTDREAAHALGLALIFAAPGVGQQPEVTGSRWLALGRAALGGVTAALAAKAGFTADLGILDGTFFPSVYGVSPDGTAVMDGLGERSVLPDVSVKPWCAARQTMAAAQATKQIMESGVTPTDMVRLVVGVPAPHFNMVNHGIMPGDRIAHLTSVPYQMALAASEPETMFDVKQRPTEVSKAVQVFMAKVSVEVDDSLLSVYPRAWPARLTVHAPSGRHETLVTHVPGDAERPLDERQVVEKGLCLLAPLIGDQRAGVLLASSLAVTERDGALASLVDEVERAT